MNAFGFGVIAALLVAGCTVNGADPRINAADAPVKATAGGTPSGAHAEPSPTVPAGCVPPSPPPDGAEYVPGEVLFAFKETTTVADRDDAKAQFGLTAMTEIGTTGSYKGEFTGSVRQMIVTMMCDGRFKYAEPNGIVRVDPRESGGFGEQPQ